MSAEKPNKRQQIFIAEYLNHGNAAQAYRIAYEKNDENVYTLGAKLVKKLKLDTGQFVENLDKSGQVDPKLARLAQQAILSAEQAMKLRAKQAIANPMDFYNEQGHLDPQLIREKGDGIVRSIKQTAYGISIELNPQDSATQDLLKHYGKLTDTTRVEVVDSPLAIFLARVRELATRVVEPLQLPTTPHTEKGSD